MSSEIAIEITGVSKHYLMFRKPEDRLKQMVVPKVRRVLNLPPKAFFTQFAAVENVSLRIGRGETVGIIGRNGSGKSTLLQMICGTLEPTSGTVKVNGRIAALLELGAGFNGDFTGRENVKLNCAILGLSHEETAARFSAIEEFADIGIFIDQPVKTYSSGMYVRLAFAVAINVDPDILVVDEALAVGDEAFQRKCFARIEQIRDRGATVLFVSHGAQTIVQLCDRAILMDRGEKILEGSPKTVVNQYQRLLNLQGPEAATVREQIKQVAGWPDESPKTTPADAVASESKREPSVDDAWLDPSLVTKSLVEYESRGARLGGFQILTEHRRPVNVLAPGYRYIFKYTASFETEARNVAFGMLLKTATGIDLAGTATHMATDEIANVPAGATVEVEMSFRCNLSPGVYFLNAGAATKQSGEWIALHRVLDCFALRVIQSDRQRHSGLVDLGIKQSVVLAAGHRQLAILNGPHTSKASADR